MCPRSTVTEKLRPIRPVRGLNQRHQDYKSNALLTELIFVLVEQFYSNYFFFELRRRLTEKTEKL